MKVAVFGATGFVGQYIIDELLSSNMQPRVLVRSGSESKCPSKCEIVSGSIDKIESIKDTMKDVGAVIYNIGIIREFPKRGVTYEGLHFQGVKKCIDVANNFGIKRFLLMSANGVKLDGTGYQKTKWQAEELLKKSGLDWTIFRPSLIFGNPNGEGRPEFCTQLRDDMLSLPIPAPLFYTGLLPFNAGSFSLSPIHASNVAKFFVKSITKSDGIGKIYNLGGEKSYTWKEIIHTIALASGKLTWKIPAPIFAIKSISLLLDRFEWFPVTRDQITMLIEGNVVNENYFSEFEIDPISFEEKNLTYLKD